ncbi:response regulator receiver domain [Pinirhizobacter soli]|uniref:response regulator receiver domain n=1 Tax=Pinirhizobacter soli TaxID=2786953 RepID=UPI00202A8138|nr:response regulator receiver domain [Pinirhizobacter soli]
MTASPPVSRDVSPRPQLDALIRAAYVEPIRSVLIVDDEFPTVDAFVGHILDTSSSTNVKPINAELAQRLIRFCRDGRRSWLVDVHNGIGGPQSVLQERAGTLHQSDLVILDYHLDGDLGDGQSAIGVLRRLAENKHFNLVIVYTKGGATKAGAGSVFFEVLSGLAGPVSTELGEDKYLMIAAELAEISLEGEGADSNADPAAAGLKADIEELSTLQSYLHERFGHNRGARGKYAEIYKRLHAALRAAGSKFVPADIVHWVIENGQRTHATFLGASSVAGMKYGIDGPINWIKTASLFVTVIDKDVDPAALEDGLISALKSSRPAPYQLLMARMRVELEDGGAVAASEILEDKHMQAGWLREFFEAETDSKVAIVSNAIDRHWESLGDRIRPNLDRYAASLVEDASTVDKEAELDYYFGAVNKEKSDIYARLNLYQNSKSVVGGHLMTGHILRVTSPRPSGDPVISYWVCLSPACDLVPGQKAGGWKESLGDHMPFVAVLLHSMTAADAVKKATENANVFLSIDGELSCFCTSPDMKSTTAPQWEQFFADNGGRFESAKSTFNLSRISSIDGKIVSTQHLAQVVGQLRYEYALNLMQRLGATMSRVGLDFYTDKKK